MGDIVKGGWINERPRQQIDEFAPFSPAKWRGTQAPPINWMVEGCFIKGTVGILAGDGGLGKSLLLQQLQTACALGVPWLGMPTQKCDSLALYCEDDEHELQRRQERINAHYGCSMDNLSGVHMESRPGRDCVLMQFRQWGGDGNKTVMFDQLAHAAKERKVKIVILDTVADVFSGNEVDRNQPRTFIRALRQLALELQGVVILTQHPSNEGMASGTGRSGSTGWHNSVRSRLYLTKPKGTDDTPTDERWLKTMKQNSSKFGGKISVTWKNGVFVLTEDATEKHYWNEDREWK